MMFRPQYSQSVLGRGLVNPVSDLEDSQTAFASPGVRMPSGAAGLSRPLLSPVHCLRCLDVHITYTKLKRGFSLQTECSQGNLVEKCHANAIQSSNDLSF